MSDLISRKALIKELNELWRYVNFDGDKDVFDIITNAPTVQREGWVSVPIEPTEEMLLAGCEAGLDIKTLMDDAPFATDKAVYKAMIKTYINK